MIRSGAEIACFCICKLVADGETATTHDLLEIWEPPCRIYCETQRSSKYWNLMICEVSRQGRVCRGNYAKKSDRF